MSNDPDDIRSYDHDPRSPYYDGRCKVCGDDQGCECDPDDYDPEGYEDDPFWKEED